MHWYPASFVPQIPDVLIQTLSQDGDRIIDPFIGSGVTLIEAAKLGREFVGADINPFAVEIAKAKFLAIELADKEWKEKFCHDIENSGFIEEPKNYIEKIGLIPEVFKWFEEKTLKELLSIHQVIASKNSNQFLLGKILFSSILCSCSSQRRHYTYITDGCYPKEFVYKPAKKLFIEKIKQTNRSAEYFKEQYKRRHSKDYKFNGDIRQKDSRKLDWIKDNSIDLIVTSPPYLGTHDYLKALRLTNLFFPEKDFKEFLSKEIGARCFRHKKTAYEDYLSDMKKVFSECFRILKPGGYMGLIMGRGKGRVIKFDIIAQLLDFLTIEKDLLIVYENNRRISSRRIRFPGVMTERIIVLRKKATSIPLDYNDNDCINVRQNNV